MRSSVIDSYFSIHLFSKNKNKNRCNNIFDTQKKKRGNHEKKQKKGERHIHIRYFLKLQLKVVLN